MRRSDSCINNVKLTLNCAKDYSPSTISRQYTKTRQKPPSLEDVSFDPWGADGSLRRSRSLAVSAEALRASWGFEGRQQGGRRRSQLIPRAKLIDRSSIRDDRLKGHSVDNLYNPEHPQIRRHSTSVPPEASYIRTRRKEQESLYSSLQNFPGTSLESTYNNKASINSLFEVSYEELSLPNYYPEARYDTDNTDNISLTDNISSNSLDHKHPFDAKPEYESISYDDNIVLSTNKKLYESAEHKPRTIRKPSSFSQNYGKINPNLQTTQREERCIEETTTNTAEGDTNTGDIIVTDQVDCVERDVSAEVVTIEEAVKDPKTRDQIKTLIEVTGETKDSEQYKTVVSVDTTREYQQKSAVVPCKPTKKVSKTHSHNYLKEFLETQKGSKKPLQNFIAKKFSNLSRKTTRDTTNLQENKFHSLPDISVSKNLRKCEKIDRKLRKCEKGNENRFIVNIGRHFDVTADGKVPVDFEVKIARVPKQKKNAHRLKSDEHFIEAVKNLKETIHGSQISSGHHHQSFDSENKLREMALLYCQEECSKELNDKLGSMKNYWNKMMGTENEQCLNQENSTLEVTTKVEDVKKKFEKQEKSEEKSQSKVQITKQLFEPKLVSDKTGKISPTIKETCSFFENKNTIYENDRSYESLCPTSVEIVDAKNNENDAKQGKIHRKVHKPLSKSNSVSVQPEFDHVRYKLVKSDLFQKKIFANCDKESQFEDLIQYLQDFSFQELLIDNNIVIIEPIRSKVPHQTSPCVKTVKNVTPLVQKKTSDNGDTKSTLNRPFFYHPIRVNKEVNEDELPNPDTVRQVRQFFEGGTSKKQTSQEMDTPKENSKESTRTNVDPDKDRCSASDSNSHLSNMSDFGSQENLYDSLDNEIYCEYVSEAILQKIREYGTTVTYYGGRVVDHKSGQPVLTKAIMEEIRDNEKRCMDCKNCRKLSNGGAEGKGKESKDKENFKGMKFRLLKSNSCSSRLELVGTDSLQETKKKLMAQQRSLRKEDDVIEECDKERNNRFNEKNAINENIKKQTMNNNSPKIIGEEMKSTDNKSQWNDITNGKSIKSINDKSPAQTIYDFYHYEKVKNVPKKIDDMEFESYEIA